MQSNYVICKILVKHNENNIICLYKKIICISNIRKNNSCPDYKPLIKKCMFDY